MNPEFKPFPYQVEGSAWLQSKKVALLADEMGLGKTAQAIMAADAIGASRILIICPAIGRYNWEREFEDKSSSPRKVQVVTKTGVKWDPEATIVTSYEGAVAAKDPGLFDLLIIDEGHFLKEPKSKRTLAILGKEGLVRKAKRVWILTGTPAPNHVGELWPILYTFGATPLNYTKFVDRYCETRVTTYGVQVTGNKIANIPELKKIVEGVMLRRLKGQVMKELPPLFYSNCLVEPGEVDISAESSFTQYLRDPKVLEDKLKLERALIEAMINNGLGRDAIFAMEALANSVSTLRRYTGLQKVHEVAETIKLELELNSYDKIVLFAIHRDVIEGLRSKLRDFNPTTLYGGFEPEKQQANIDRFQKNPKCRVMIANIKSAGTSVTLTAAHNVAFVELDWVPANNAQAIMRCHRIGQKNTVFVRFFSLNNFIDERVNKVLARKTKDLAEIFDVTSLTKSNHVDKTVTPNVNTHSLSDDELLKELNQ